jgi:hypothetical protein
MLTDKKPNVSKTRRSPKLSQRFATVKTVEEAEEDDNWSQPTSMEMFWNFLERDIS